MLDRFEAVTGDVVAAVGANVVKRIGDAVMYVTNAPGIGCTLGLDLIEACAALRLPKLRVGVAFGDVIVRQGDFYGPTVNLAARRRRGAEPGTVLADAELHGRLGGIRGRYAFVPGVGSRCQGSRHRSRRFNCCDPEPRGRWGLRELQRRELATAAARSHLRTGRPDARPDR